MPRKPPLEPSRLSQILKHLQQEPIPILPRLQSMRLTYAMRNDHFGARHFVKEDLPRIAYANPTLSVVLDRKLKKPEDSLVPEMLLEFRDGSQHKIDMEQKWSTTIFAELLEVHSNRGGKKPASTTPGEQRKRIIPQSGVSKRTRNASTPV